MFMLLSLVMDHVSYMMLLLLLWYLDLCLNLENLRWGELVESYGTLGGRI